MTDPKKALEPFALRAFQYDGSQDEWFCTPSVQVGDLRRAREAYDALEAAGGVVVPREPTEAMWKAGAHEFMRLTGALSATNAVPTMIYRAMIAAAPAAPQDRGVRMKALREFVDFVRQAPVSSGVCCCGDDMEKHADPMSCGHAPVDQWDHSLSQWLKEIDPLLAALADPSPAPAAAVMEEAVREWISGWQQCGCVDAGCAGRHMERNAVLDDVEETLIPLIVAELALPTQAEPVAASGEDEVAYEDIDVLAGKCIPVWLDIDWPTHRALKEAISKVIAADRVARAHPAPAPDEACAEIERLEKRLAAQTAISRNHNANWNAAEARATTAERERDEAREDERDRLHTFAKMRFSGDELGFVLAFIEDYGGMDPSARAALRGEAG
jgi:hypothetical protein